MLARLQCEIVGHRTQASCGFRAIVGSYPGELRCPNEAVEKVYLLREGYELGVCRLHLDLFPPSALDLALGRDLE